MAEDSNKTCAHCGARPADRVEARVDERAQAEAYYKSVMAVDRAEAKRRMLALRKRYGDERAVAFNAISAAYTAMFGEEPPPSGHPSSGTEGGSA